MGTWWGVLPSASLPRHPTFPRPYRVLIWNSPWQPVRSTHASHLWAPYYSSFLPVLPNSVVPWPTGTRWSSGCSGQLFIKRMEGGRDTTTCPFLQIWCHSPHHIYERDNSNFRTASLVCMHVDLHAPSHACILHMYAQVSHTFTHNYTLPPYYAHVCHTRPMTDIHDHHAHVSHLCTCVPPHVCATWLSHTVSHTHELSITCTA